jgi:hypothetical protein
VEDHVDSQSGGVDGIHDRRVRGGDVYASHAPGLPDRLGRRSEELLVPGDVVQIHLSGASVDHLLGHLRGHVGILNFLLGEVGAISPAPQGIHSRSQDLVFLAEPCLLHGLRHAPVRGRPDGRRPVRELQVVDVLERKWLLPQVVMQVHHSRHHVHSRSVNDSVARRPVGILSPLCRHGIEGDHLGDGVRLNDNIVGACRRPPVAFDNMGATDHESVIRTVCELSKRPLRPGRGSSQEQKESNEKTQNPRTM